MKVLFWIGTFPTISETFIRNQIVDLINEGIEVQILCFSKNSDNQGLEGFEQYDLLNKTLDFSDIIPYSKKEKIKKFLNILIRSLRTYNFWYFIKFFRLLLVEKNKYPFSFLFLLDYLLVQKIDVIHCHFGPIGNKAVFVKKIKLPIRLICTFHGYDIRLGIKKGKPFYKSLFDWADSIISISNYNKEMLLSFGLQADKIKELNNGVEINDLCNKKKNKNQKITILSVGRLVEEKGYLLALNAINIFVKKYPKIKFQYHIIGGGVLEKELIKKCNDLNIDSLVTFHLSQNSEYVKNKMVEADFFLLSSINEAMPTVILEAQSHKLPVLATNVGSVKDLIIDDTTGFLCDASEMGIFKGLEKMFENIDKWEIYGKIAKENIVRNYDRTKIVQKLIEIYKN